ncbi:MAG: transporter substrate-binding protein [Planctomycetia bacterium]|nr:transporter substrate-binding protein [Planctomycetia bacterium]
MKDPDPIELTQSVVLPDGNTVSSSPRQFPFVAPREGSGELGRFDDYRILRLLGSGGMGFVFEAEELTLRRPVAIKILRPELATDPISRERFLREARAAAEIISDHVVTVLRVGESANLPYLVMPLLFGETLQARIERPTLLELRTALAVARDTAEGLSAAHARGLTHRDIKPANIWLETDGPGGSFKRARILDFGLARKPHGETSLTSTGFIVGTPNYMAPEQASGNDVDHRADLFSLGCVMYTMLTGEMPFQGNSAMAVMMALANKTPEPVDVKNPAVPRAVAGLVARLLEKDPAQRVQTAAEVVGELDVVLGAMAGCVPCECPPPALVGKLDALDTQATPGKSDTLPGQRPVPTAPTPTTRQRKRRAVVVWVSLVGVLVLAGFIGWQAFHTPTPPPTDPEPIVVGILHSQSGPMAVSEGPVIDATLLAIEELNAGGGVLGRPIKPVVYGKSDPDEFARLAEKLITEDQAVVIFGCWTSSSRKAVRPVVERNASLLFYPVQYEGLEESPRIIYLGPTSNQQLIPAVDFLIDTLKKKRIFLVGSDYVFPQAAHQIIMDRVEQKAGEAKVVGEAFLPLNSSDALDAFGRVQRANPDAIVNTINGTTNAAFFRELHDPKRGLPNVTTISVSIAENEVRGLNPPTMKDDYLVASYFQTVNRPENRAFIQKIQAKYGNERVTSDMMAAAYSGVHLWAKAATAATSVDPSAVISAVRGLEFDGPRARVKIDPANLHSWLPVRIGKIQPSGAVTLVTGAGSETPIRPMPFPPSRKPEVWDQFLENLKLKWGGKWQAPSK